MARTPLFVFMTCSISGCGRSDAPQDKIEQAIHTAERQSQQQAAIDPARQPHLNDANPLRRKLCGLQICEIFFGTSQTLGDWIAYLPCARRYAGLPVAAVNRLHLKRSSKLQQSLLTKAPDDGFSDVTINDVMDGRISGAAVHTP